jgi:hypothetical protein
MKPDGQVPPPLLPTVRRLFGNRDPRTENQDARAGDQWTVLEMWLSACVGCGFKKTPSLPICLAGFF